MTALEDRETLLRYRLEQAEETLEDAQKMLRGGKGDRLLFLILPSITSPREAMGAEDLPPPLGQGRKARRIVLSSLTKRRCNIIINVVK